MNEQAGSKETTMALTELYDKAYRSGLRDGQERMRERCASHADTYGLGALADAIRALPVEE